MLLGDSHIEEPVWKTICKAFQPCSLLHRRGNRHDIRIPFSHLDHNRGKNIRPGYGPSALRDSGRYVKRAGPVKSGRMPDSRSVAMPLFGLHMHDHRTVNPLCVLKETNHRGYIMTVHRPEIGKSHILKKHSRNDKLLDAVLRLPDPLDHFISAMKLLKLSGHLFLQICVRVRRPERREIIMHSSHISGNRHVVVIQNNNKIRLQLRGIVKRLIGHAAGQRPVTDHRYNRVLLSSQIPRPGVAERGGNGIRAVSRVPRITAALLPPRKTGKSTLLPKR